MPYRQLAMDRGDMDRGGFFGGLASIAKGALRVGVGFLAGGPVGAGTALVKHAASELGSGAANPIGSTPAPIPSNITVGLRPANTTSAEELVRQHQINVHKAQARGQKIGPGVGGAASSIPYVPRHLQYPGEGRRRTMRVTNVKALRRAIRRATGFSKLAMKVIKVVNPQKKGKFGGWKKK